jgi:hypothetical protein
MRNTKIREELNVFNVSKKKLKSRSQWKHDVLRVQDRRIPGRAIAQAVSRWLPTASARVRFRAEHVGFVVDIATLGQVFSEYFGFPWQSFHQFLHHHNHPGLAQ